LRCELPFVNVMEILTKEPDPLPTKTTPGFRELIGRMLRKDPEERPTAMELLASPAFGPQKIIVWRDPAIFTNAATCAELQALQAKHGAVVRIIAAEVNEDAGQAIDQAEKAKLWVISSETANGRSFLERCRTNGVTGPCLLVSETSSSCSVPG
jgi:serine/threonine protein kinase